MQKAHPDVPIYLAAIDDHLNERGYIVPGSGGCRRPSVWDGVMDLHEVNCNLMPIGSLEFLSFIKEMIDTSWSDLSIDQNFQFTSTPVNFFKIWCNNNKREDQQDMQHAAQPEDHRQRLQELVEWRGQVRQHPWSRAGEDRGYQPAPQPIFPMAARHAGRTARASSCC